MIAAQVAAKAQVAAGTSIIILLIHSVPKVQKYWHNGLGTCMNLLDLHKVPLHAQRPQILGCISKMDEWQPLYKVMYPVVEHSVVFNKFCGAYLRTTLNGSQALEDQWMIIPLMAIPSATGEYVPLLHDNGGTITGKDLHVS